jgi:hypothetical protein
MLEQNREIANMSNSQEISTQSSILKVMLNEKSYQHKLKLLTEPPKILYKERNFSFKCLVEDAEGNRLKLKKTLKFSLVLFTVDNPPTELIQNTSGNRIIRSNFDINEDIVEFRKICINEVSSHYRNSVFCLGIKCEDCCGIEPLVIPDIIVKARKIKSPSTL